MNPLERLRSLASSHLPLVLAVFIAGLAIGRCGQTSTPIRDASHTDHAHESSELYTCSMHPEVRAPEPGSCPICGMDLIPFGDAEDSVAGPRISLSPRAKTLAKITTARVTMAKTDGRPLRLLGKVDYDETRVRTVTSWVSGRVEQLKVAATGQSIRRGQVVAVVYSPEVYAAQSDLIQARKQLVRLAKAAPEARAAAESARNAARERLKLLGIPESDVKAMEAADSPWRQMSIRSSYGGTVLARKVDPGSYVQPGSELFQVADLGRVWIQLDAYESDLSRLSVGLKVRLTSRSLPGEVFEGKIAFIDPVVAAASRTARVRVEVTNPKGRLRPGMFAEANIDGPSTGSQLVVPESAVLFTGARSVVFVEVPGASRPTYEAREVVVESASGAMIPVLSGLAKGDRVVIRGAFALDADLQLRGGDSMMSRLDDNDRIDIDSLSPELKKQLESLLVAYLDAADALAADDLEGSLRAAKRLEALAALEVGAKQVGGETWNRIAPEWRAHAKKLSSASELVEARRAFQFLSKTALATVRRFGNPLAQPIRVASCPMVFDGTGGTWLQRGDTVNNAYAGNEMLTCGSIDDEIAPATAAKKPSGGRDE